MQVLPDPASNADAPAQGASPGAEDAPRLAHELHGHLSELEAQNQELRGIRAELEAQRAKLIARYDAWLTESEARFRRFTELSADWYWETDEQGRYTLLSGRVRLEPAFDVRSALGGSHLDLAKRLGAGVVQLAPALPELERALAERKSCRDSLSKWIFGDASERFFLSSFEPMADPLGRFSGWRGVTRNVTEFEQVAAALVRTGKRFELALAAASTFVFALDLRSALLTLHGAPRFGGPGSVVELPIGDALSNVVPDDAQTLLALIEQVRDGALTSVDFEYRVGWPDASHWTWRRLQVKVVAHDAQTGRALHLAGTSTDIGERKRAEMRLRDREERLRLSELRYRLAAASGQLWDWDVASGRFNVAPESWRRLGFEAPPPGEEIARYAALIHPDDLPASARRAARAPGAAHALRHGVSRARLCRPLAPLPYAGQGDLGRSRARHLHGWDDGGDRDRVIRGTNLHSRRRHAAAACSRFKAPARPRYRAGSADPNMRGRSPAWNQEISE